MLLKPTQSFLVQKFILLCSEVFFVYLFVCLQNTSIRPIVSFTAPDFVEKQEANISKHLAHHNLQRFLKVTLSFNYASYFTTPVQNYLSWNKSIFKVFFKGFLSRFGLPFKNLLYFPFINKYIKQKKR